MRAFRSTRRRAGVTLIELMLVVALLGIVAAVVTPRIGAGLTSARLDRAARVVYGDLQLAPQLAARQRKPVKIIFDVTNRKYTIVDRATPTTIYIARDLGSASEFKVSAISTDVVNNALEFFPNGITSGNMTVTVTTGSRSRTVRITTAGFVRM